MKKKILLSLLLLNIFACSVMGCGKPDEVSTKMMNDIDAIGEVTIEDEETINNLNITVRQSRQSGVARATCPD